MSAELTSLIREMHGNLLLSATAILGDHINTRDTLQVGLRLCVCATFENEIDEFIASHAEVYRAFVELDAMQNFAVVAQLRVVVCQRMEGDEDRRARFAGPRRTVKGHQLCRLCFGEEKNNPMIALTPLKADVASATAWSWLGLRPYDFVESAGCGALFKGVGVAESNASFTRSLSLLNHFRAAS
jgi:hypothetical protein